MRKFFWIVLIVMANGLLVIGCNSDEGSTTTKNDDPGSADSLGAGQTNNNNVNNSDAAFLNEAHYDGLKEVEAGKVAQAKGQAPEVRNFAGMMVKDHFEMGGKVKALATKKNVALRDTLSADDREKITNAKKTGREFDRAYAAMMVDEHEAAVRKFENAANNAKDAEIKALATEALPKLRGHLEMAKAVRDKVKG
ncbi:MAG: hypothetical protein K0Q66_1519 [Chitinophagaceae bacterium]|nr:hypothetical protein [Chitinophagaceae bacterium]